MDIKFWIIIGVFYLIRALLKKDSNKKDKPTGTKVLKKKNKGLEDIFGDFMKEINKGQESQKKPKTLFNSDNHKAEEDTNKKLDWQEVTRSKFDTLSSSKKHTDYQKVSHSNIPDEPVKLTEVESDEDIKVLEEIDLRKAVLYKEILDRKYFSV